MRIFTFLLTTILSLHGSPSEPSDDSRLVAGLLDVLKTYDEEEIAKYVQRGNTEFADLRRYYGWYVYGTEPVQTIALGSASQRKRYVHVECKISDNVWPGRDWNNYLIEIRQLDEKSLLSKIGIPEKGVDIKDWEASPKQIAELIIASKERNPSAVTEVQIICQEDLANTAEVKAYRCSLVETRLVHSLRIPTYVDAVIYIIKRGDHFTGHLVRLMDYEMARLPCTLSAREWIPAGAKVCYKSHYEDGLLPDGKFSLKLKITKDQFDAIVTKLGATPHAESRKYSDDKRWLSWNPDSGADDPFTNHNQANKAPPKGENLWDPDKDLSTTFVRQHKDTWTFLKYERGYLYFKELTH